MPWSSRLARAASGWTDAGGGLAGRRPAFPSAGRDQGLPGARGIHTRIAPGARLAQA